MAERKRILITGAAGRIALMVREALAPDHDITGVDIRPSEANPGDAVADMTDLEAIRSLSAISTSSSTSRTTPRAA